MRKEFAKVIAEMIREDKSIYLLDLDFGSIFSELIKENPNNYIPLCISEQASIGVASGMALEGLKPYVYAITTFLLERPFEQIKLDIVQQKANVKLISYVNYPRAGPTHNTKEAKGLCKILEIDYVKPKDSVETKQKLLEYSKLNKPVFFHLIKDNGVKNE